MDKDEALWVESKLGLDPNSELKTISLINMTHPSLEEALDKITPRVTNSREILDNKMTNECHRHGIMETMFPSIDIHEETLLELENKDDIDEHESYCMSTSLNPCSHEKSPESIGLYQHEISSRAGAHEQAGRVCSMELEIYLASTQGISILCTPPEMC